MPSLPQQAPVISAPEARFIVSWWEREVHVWILRKSAADIFNTGGEDVDLNQNRKLLKTIMVKGESNITSATINEDGTLLVVSTATAIKAFKLEHEDPVKPSDVKLAAVELPRKITALGASRVQLSPNGRWIAIVREGSRVWVGKIDTPQDQETTFNFHPQPQRLSRLQRSIPRYVKNGGLGTYERTITQVVFSPDSKMLAAADLAGYLDTWVLRGAGEHQQNGTKPGGEDDASSSSESDSSDDDAAIPPGERWVRNPSAKLLPKLPSAPAVLSFSDDVPGTTSPSLQDAESAAADDYTLLAVTVSWQIFVFHPSQGSLTPWSRKHPRKALPAPVQDLLDLAKGVVWQGPRAWIYGVSFLLMIDLSQDLPKPAPESDAPTDSPAKPGLKRKRTGAGGRMEQGNIAPHQIRKLTAGQWEDIDMDDVPRDAEADSDDDDDMDKAEGELVQLRSRRQEEAVGSSDEMTQQRKSWWMTYKYRPIFGIVPLSAVDQPLEVALVERPTWDVDTQEKYFSLEEWER